MESASKKAPSQEDSATHQDSVAGKDGQIEKVKQMADSKHRADLEILKQLEYEARLSKDVAVQGSPLGTPSQSSAEKVETGGAKSARARAVARGMSKLPHIGITVSTNEGVDDVFIEQSNQHSATLGDRATLYRRAPGGQSPLPTAPGQARNATDAGTMLMSESMLSKQFQLQASPKVLAPDD